MIGPGDLPRHWESLLPGQAGLGAELEQRWSEPHRHYHDLQHLAETLNALGRLGPAGRTEHLALWFHDAIHTGTPGEDEHLSAELAATLLLPAGLGRAETAEVSRLVLLTVDHRPAADDQAGARVCDADLANLGAESDRYLTSVRALRAEFGELDEDAWRAARKAAIKVFSSASPLFHTSLGNSWWEDRARANLAAELKQLR